MATMIETFEEQTFFTVSQLTLETRQVLEEAFDTVWIMGEISNLARPSSGHLYFSLKDEKAQVRCAFFRMRQRGLDFKPENGQQVLIHAKVSLYEPRGDFQLIVSSMQMAGAGALQIKFEQLKNKLAEEGLFDQAHKQEIPELPQRIGVITSPSGAAIRDILTVLKRRFAAIPVILYPSQVQGEKASAQLVRMIEIANQRDECDVLILARGGGSLEDLWPFNEENLARAMFKSNIPIVTGIGHEVDFTISDFVGDQRTATPSAAAEWVSPDKTEWQQRLNHHLQQLTKHIQQDLKHAKLQLAHLQKRLQHPGQKLQQHAQRLDDYEKRLIRAWRNLFNARSQKLQALMRALDAVSPLNTLGRGYAIVSNTKTNEIIHSINQCKVGEKLSAKLKDGELICDIVDIKGGQCAP